MPSARLLGNRRHALQEQGRAAIIRRLRNATSRPLGLRQLLIGLSLAGIVPLAIVATVLLVALWRAQQRALGEGASAEAYALAALLVIVLVASGLFAWLIGRRIAGAIQAAATAAAAMGEGKPLPLVPSRVEEVQALMQALERAAARRAAAEADRARTVGEADAVLQQERAARFQAETANRAKDEFLAMLGHELWNPLGAISGAIRVLERLPSTSGDHKAARDIIARQSAHLAKIVDDLLDVGRLVSGRILLRRNLVDLAQASSAAVATLRAAEREGGHEWSRGREPVRGSGSAT